MHGQKQVRLQFVGDFRPTLQRDECIVASGMNDFRAQPRLDKFAESFANIQNKVFFEQATRTGGAGIVSAVSRIENNPAYLQTQHTGHRLRISQLGRPGLLGTF